MSEVFRIKVLNNRQYSFSALNVIPFFKAKREMVFNIILSNIFILFYFAFYTIPLLIFFGVAPY